MGTQGPETLRADAQRNLVRVLDAAAELFAERGLDAGVADIARRAGVGTATVFRRFPTKEDLIVAVFVQRVEELTEKAAALADSGDDAGTALHRFMEVAVEMQLRDRGFQESVGLRYVVDPRVRPQLDALDTQLERLHRAATEAGTLRDDLDVYDIPVLYTAVARVADLTGGAGRDAWRRYLGLVFDGMRPESATPLAAPPPSRQELETALGSGRRASPGAGRASGTSRS